MCLFRLDTQDKRTNKTKQINKLYGKTKYSFKDYYMCLLGLDTQDKRTNKTKHIYSKHSTHVFFYGYLFKVLSFLNGYTGQTVKQHIHSKYSTHVFLNGHRGQMVIQHINSKHSTHVFF